MSNHRKTGKSTNDVRSANNSDQKESLKSASTHALATALTAMVRELTQPLLFSLGQVVATPGAIDLLDRAGVNANDILARHQRGDWGVVCADDAAENTRALQDGNRLLSAYELGSGRERLWVITEYDRSVTTLLLPEEY